MADETLLTDDEVFGTSDGLLSDDDVFGAPQRPLPPDVKPSDAGAGRGSSDFAAVDPRRLDVAPVGRRGGRRSEFRPFVGGDAQTPYQPEQQVIGDVTPAMVLNTPVDTGGGSQADLIEMSKSPARQEAERQALSDSAKREAFYARSGVLKAAPEPTVIDRALQGTIARPLDRSLAGLAIETAGDAARGVVRASQGLGSSVWSGLQAAAETIGAEDVGAFAGAAGRVGREARNQTQNTSDPNSLTQQIFESTFTSVPLVAALGGSAGLAGMMAQSAANDYGESRDRGLNHAEALPRAAWMGIAEGIGERFGLPQLSALFSQAMKKAGPGAFAKTLADLVWREQAGEQVTLALQNAYEATGPQGTKPNLTLEQYLQEAANTALVTAGQSLVTGGLAAGVRKLGGPQPEAKPDLIGLARSKGFLGGAAGADPAPDAAAAPAPPDAPAPAPAPRQPTVNDAVGVTPVRGAEAAPVDPTTGITKVEGADDYVEAQREALAAAAAAGLGVPGAPAPAVPEPGPAEPGGVDQPATSVAGPGAGAPGGAAAAAPVRGPISALSYTQNADGTLTVNGDPDTVAALVPSLRPIPTSGGLVVGRTRAKETKAAVDAINGVPETFPAEGDAIAFAQRNGIGDRVDVARTDGGGFVLRPRPQAARTMADSAQQAQAVQELEAALGRTQKSGPVTVELVPDAELAAGPGIVSRMVNAVRAVFNVPIVAVRGSGVNGTYLNGRVFVDVEAIQSGQGNWVDRLFGVIGHESEHFFQKSQDAADQQTNATLRAVIDQYRRPGSVPARQAWEQSKRSTVLPSDYGVNEVDADLSGAMWKDSKFWSRLYEADNGSTARRVFYRFMQAATRLTAVIRGENLDPARWVTNIDAVREAYVTAWAERAGRTRAPQQAAAPTDAGAPVAAAQREPTPPVVTVGLTQEGWPEIVGDKVDIVSPLPTERIEFIPAPGQQLLNYTIMPAGAFDVLGYVELVVEGGRVTMLLDIEIGSRAKGTGRAVIESILASNPDQDVLISNIVDSARGFWDKMGVPEQNQQYGDSYDGILNWRTYAETQNPGRALEAAGEDPGARQEAVAGRQGPDRGAAGAAPREGQDQPAGTPQLSQADGRGEGQRDAAAATDLDTDGQLIWQGWNQPREVPVVPAARKLRGLLDRLSAGELTPAEFELQVRMLSGRMDDVSAAKQWNRGLAERERGVDIVREKLLAARRRGELDHDAVEFALWALGRNPQLAEGLGISVRASRGDAAVGDYNPATRIMRVFKGGDRVETAVHEILHHSERMLPREVQLGIETAWRGAYAQALADASRAGNTRRVDALLTIPAAIQGPQRSQELARQELMKALAAGHLDRDRDYQLFNPSEYWAENATDILRGRFEAANGDWGRLPAWVAQARQWLSEMLERVKGLLGLDSKAPILRGLDAVLGGDGSFQSGGLISESARPLDVAPTMSEQQHARLEKEADAYEAENGIRPYVPAREVTVPVELPLFSQKESGKYGNDPVHDLPLNKNGTVTLYYPTTGTGARAVARDKVLRPEPGQGRVYLTNESSGWKVMGAPGPIVQPMDGSAAMVQVDPRLLHALATEGRRDFFIPVKEGAAFAGKMQRLWALNAPRNKAISPDVTMARIREGVTLGIEGYTSLDAATQKEALDAAKDVLRREHNVSTLLGVNGKLEKTNTGDYGLKYDGKSVISMGLGMASAQRLNDKLSTCPQSAACESLCLGDTSGQNLLYGGMANEAFGSQARDFRSGPRLSQYLKTEAFVLHPEEFAVVLHAEILALEKWAKKNGYQPSVRLNVTTDFPPSVWEALIKAHPDTYFYDYTKLNNTSIAPNHHLTYSSTGASQTVAGKRIVNRHSNWDQMVRHLNRGRNVAMAFSSRTAMPKWVVDERTGARFEVWNGDNYDARFLDPKRPDGIGMIVGLTNKDKTGKPEEAAEKNNGFFIDYDPARDGDTVTIPIQERAAIPLAQASQRDDMPERYAGVMVEQEVRIEETGQVAKLRLDAGAVLADLDNRRSTFERLLACLG